jgi:hypothetical protein
MPELSQEPDRLLDNLGRSSMVTAEVTERQDHRRRDKFAVPLEDPSLKSAPADRLSRAAMFR